jgi:anti-anti-sigma regulatory factor
MRIVGMLCRARLEARRRGDGLTFTRPSADLAALIELCGVDDVILGDGQPPASSMERRSRSPGD